MATEGAISLGEQIKADIKAKKLNGSAIARDMNVSRQVINQIQLRKKFDIEFLQKLKEASGLDYTNYIFNPRHDNYEPVEVLSSYVQEPDGYEKQITVEIKISAGIKAIGLHFASFLSALQKEGSKYGFKIE